MIGRLQVEWRLLLRSQSLPTFDVDGSVRKPEAGARCGEDAALATGTLDELVVEKVNAGGTKRQ